MNVDTCFDLSAEKNKNYIKQPGEQREKVTAVMGGG